jgi:hypothetical protein
LEGIALTRAQNEENHDDVAAPHNPSKVPDLDKNAASREHVGWIYALI